MEGGVERFCVHEPVGRGRALVLIDMVERPCRFTFVPKLQPRGDAKPSEQDRYPDRDPDSRSPQSDTGSAVPAHCEPNTESERARESHAITGVVVDRPSRMTTSRSA